MQHPEEKVEALDTAGDVAPDGEDFEAIPAQTLPHGWQAAWEPLVDDLCEMSFDDVDANRAADRVADVDSCARRAALEPRRMISRQCACGAHTQNC